MKLGRLDVGFWKYEREPFFEEWFEVSYNKALCGCHIVTVSRLCITWLVSDCYFESGEKK